LSVWCRHVSSTLLLPWCLLLGMRHALAANAAVIVVAMALVSLARGGTGRFAGSVGSILPADAVGDAQRQCPGALVQEAARPVFLEMRATILRFLADGTVSDAEFALRRTRPLQSPGQRRAKIPDAVHSTRQLMRRSLAEAKARKKCADEKPVKLPTTTKKPTMLPLGVTLQSFSSTTSAAPPTIVPLGDMTDEEIAKLNESRQNASADCLLSVWSEWSVCEHPSTDARKAPMRSRSRIVVHPQREGGKPCNDTCQMEGCTTDWDSLSGTLKSLSAYEGSDESDVDYSEESLNRIPSFG